jgi:hypothetical protein
MWDAEKVNEDEERVQTLNYGEAGKRRKPFDCSSHQNVRFKVTAKPHNITTEIAKPTRVKK